MAMFLRIIRKQKNLDSILMTTLKNDNYRKNVEALVCNLLLEAKQKLPTRKVH